MESEPDAMDIVAIRNLFLQEVRDFLIALDIETDDELNERRQRIKLVESVLEKKKKEWREQFFSKSFFSSSGSIPDQNDDDKRSQRTGFSG